MNGVQEGESVDLWCSEEDEAIPKKNPYSIDELLKKTPQKKCYDSYELFLQQPCGLLLDRGCTCNIGLYSHLQTPS